MQARRNWQCGYRATQFNYLYMYSKAHSPIRWQALSYTCSASLESHSSVRWTAVAPPISLLSRHYRLLTWANFDSCSLVGCKFLYCNAL